MEWPSIARRPTDKLSGPTERAPPLVLFRVLLSLSLSLSLSISLALSWQFGTAALTLGLICASMHGTSSQASFPRESSNPTTTEENWRGLIHLEAGASTCQREGATKRKADTANYGMPYHQYLQGWQEHRLLHLDQGTRAVLGARNAPLQESLFWI